MSSWRQLQEWSRWYSDDRRRERLFLASLGFFVTFGVTRTFTHAVRSKVGPFRDVSTGGTHIHHSFWGIFSLLAMGYAWVLEIGTASGCL